MTITAEELDALERLHGDAQGRGCERWVSSPHDDELSQVYSPNTRRILRSILPIAETTVSDGKLIVEMYNALPALLSAARRGMEIESALDFMADERDGKSECWQHCKPIIRSIHSKAILQTARELGWRPKGGESDG
jgi:hypothetical protein